MPRWSIVLLVLALLMAVLGFGGLVIGALASIVKVLFVVFVVVFLASLVIGRRRAL